MTVLRILLVATLVVAAEASIANRVVPEEQFHDDASENSYSSQQAATDAVRSGRASATNTGSGSIETLLRLDRNTSQHPPQTVLDIVDQLNLDGDTNGQHVAAEHVTNDYATDAARAKAAYHGATINESNSEGRAGEGADLVQIFNWRRRRRTSGHGRRRHPGMEARYRRRRTGIFG